MNVRLVTFAILMVSLAGCASTGELADKPVQLQPDQGIAAIMLDAPHRITQITYVAKDKHGTDFEVPDTRGGPALYLVPATAGRYCLKHFRYWRVVFRSTEDLGCLTVVAGHITFGGVIVPSIQPEQAITDQQFKPDAFATLLHQQYPVLAGLYPLASAPQPPAGVDATPPTSRLSTWTQEVPGKQAQAIYVQNNTSWSIELTDLDIVLCSNTNVSCGEHTLNVVLKPFSRREIMTISANDASKDFSYRYDFSYLNAD